MFSAEALLTLINEIGGIVWEADGDAFQFTFVSREAEYILGYPASAWLEPGFWRNHTHPEDVERCTAFCLDATRQGRDHTFEYRMIAADGRVVWLRDIVTVKRMPDGTTRLFGMALDITVDKLEGAGKLRLTRLYEALIENSSDGIALLDEEGRTVYQGAAIERLIGYEPSDLVGRSSFELVHPGDVDVARQRFAEILQTDTAVGPVRLRTRHKGGRWCVLETIGKRFRDEDGRIYVVLNNRDVTDVVEAQRALEATQEQLAHAMKMEAVGRLAGGIAHDFNNLLTVIAGYADLLATTFEVGDPRTEDVGEIRRATEALPVLADRSQVEQVLMNLAVNARDAMPLGGCLSVATSAGDGSAVLRVSDSGSGMQPGVIERIFEPFFTTKEVGKGTGLGLSTVYGIVKQSGGDIQVSSEIERGTSFTIALPLASTAEPAATPHVQRGPRGTETILLVEDERRSSCSRC